MNPAVLKRARVKRHPWLVAFDVNMSPVEFETSLWFQKNRMRVVAVRKASTCRSKGAKGEWIEKVYDNVIACSSLEGNISQMEEVEDLSRGRTKQCPLWLKEKRRCRHGTSRRCRRCCLVTVEEGCQEEAQKKKAEKKES